MKTSVLLGFLGLVGHALADPTWPSDIDELEEIMFQLESFRARKFADTVNPCNSEASGPGRVTAAEWLRTAFHDMSTANTYFKRGGLDGSLQYELTNNENKGPGLKTTIEFMAPYVSKKASLSDLLAMGVYTSVRACGGPIVPIRAGRKDATRKGDAGVPQPENSVLSFQNQFDRMGFTNVEMIQVTACGHTIGGVHNSDFADLIAPGLAVNGQAVLDGSVSVFDNKVVTEYLDGTTTSPLVKGPAVKLNKHSDFKVYNSDNNMTMEAMRDPQTFRSVCKVVLEKMINVVPPGVTLGEPIVPYMVKPVALQLTLSSGGNALRFTGYIRVKTTDLAKDAIKNVIITYKNREGASQCGTRGCTISTTVQGVSQGFDDTFAFFPIEHEIPASTGISSFQITINYTDGTSTDHDNNGNQYPLQDAVLLQIPQSCLLGSTGALTVTAAVRNDRVSQGAQALISYKTPQSNSPSPKLNSATVDLQKGVCMGQYTLFSTDYTITGGMAYQTYIDIKNGDFVDSFKPATEVGGTCREFANPAVCDGGSQPSESSSATPDSSSSSSTALPSGSSSSASSSSLTTLSRVFSSQVSSAISTPASTVTSVQTSSSATSTPSLHHRDNIGEYLLVSCWTDDVGSRTLRGKQTAGDKMTLESCAEFCSGFVYWGTEYGKECFCGNSLDNSKEAPLEDCNMICSGDDTQYCGDANRLELYSTTATQPTATSTSAPASPTHIEAVGDYTLVGCWTELASGRALNQLHQDTVHMTNERCASICEGFRYFGTQFSSECYCGSHVAKNTKSAPLEDCYMTCAGDTASYCGGSGSLELYMNPDVVGGDPEQPIGAGDFVWSGCRSEPSGARALSDKATAGSGMTNAVCADFCKDYEFFGTEYGNECFCGNSLPEESKKTPAGECNMLCSGSVVEYCGAGNRLSVYTKKEDEIIEAY